MEFIMGGMQGLIRWLGAHYALYDEFSFWRTESRRDHSKLLEHVEHLQHQVNSISAKIGPSSPISTPTRLIDDAQSPEIISGSGRPSERMARGASIHAQGMRKAPRKDLQESFKDCDDAVPTTQLLPGRLARGSKSPATLSPGSRGARLPRGTKSPRTTSVARKDSRLAGGSKSPGTVARGQKPIRQGHAPQRDTPRRQSTLEGSVKRAKAQDVGEGKFATSNGLMIFFYTHSDCIRNHICRECMVTELDLCRPKIGIS
jgi:hypothetical protein